MLYSNDLLAQAELSILCLPRMCLDKMSTNMLVHINNTLFITDFVLVHFWGRLKSIFVTISFVPLVKQYDNWCVNRDDG